MVTYGSFARRYNTRFWLEGIRKTKKIPIRMDNTSSLNQMHSECMLKLHVTNYTCLVTAT
jgi:hypothetical protein